MPKGKWTSYGDLAELGGTSALAVGQHVAMGGPHAGYHVLGSDGRPRKDFRWDDPTDTRSQQEALAEEGVDFNDKAQAASSQRLRAQELKALIAKAEQALG